MFVKEKGAKLGSFFYFNNINYNISGGFVR